MRNGPILGSGPIQIRVKIKKNRIGTIRYLGHMDKSGQKNLVYLGLGNIQKIICNSGKLRLVISLPHERDGVIYVSNFFKLKRTGYSSRTS